MRLDRYIWIEWLKVFLLTFFSVLGILLLDDIQDDVQSLIEYGAGAYDLTIYYLVRVPVFIPIVLPVAFLVSLLFALGKLHQNLEIAAMRAAGMSLWRITRSLWITGIVLSLALFYLNANLVPWSMEQSKSIWNNHRFEKELITQDVDDVGLVYNLTFYNSVENRLWFIDRFNQINFRTYGITLSELDEKGNEIERLVANEGYYDDFSEKWVLQKGRATTFDPVTYEPVRSLPFEMKEFQSFVEDPQLMKLLEEKPKDLSFWELGKVLQVIESSYDKRVRPYEVAYFDRLFNPLVCLIVVGLAIPFALSGVRVNPMVGVSKAMGWFIVYWLISSFSQLMGRGFISPSIAALLPHLLAIFLIAWLFLRFRKPV